MRNYEIMMIIDPDVDERQVSPLVEKYTKIVTDAKGAVDKVDLWGKRRLAYEINKKSEGIYVVINLTAAPDDVKEMDRRMSIDEQIMRTKVMRPDAH